MTDKIGKYDNKWWKSISGIGLLGKRVSDWCSPPNGPPEVKKPKTPKDKAAELGLIQEAGSHGAFSDNNSRWTYPPTAPPQVKDGCDCCEDKIIELPKKHFIEEELETLEQWVKEAETWSEDYVHVMGLIAHIACFEKVPLKYRTRASAFIRSNVHEPIVATTVK